MTWSRSALSDYVYGTRIKLEKDQDGRVVPIYQTIDSHEWNGKTIPSGFFTQPGAENISAILFSNAATITKFNRMGKLAKLGGENVKMIKQGFLYNPDPNATEAIAFAKDIDDNDYEESWSESLIKYHNPYAKHPVKEELFSDISHVHFDETEGFIGYHQPYDVLSSTTLVITSNK